MIPAPRAPRMPSPASSAFLSIAALTDQAGGALDAIDPAARFAAARAEFDAAIAQHRSSPWGLTMADDLANAERFDAAASALLATPAPDAEAIRYKVNVAHHSGYRSTPEEQVSLMTDALRVYGMGDGQ